MTLGDVLAHLDDETAAAEALLGLGDLKLLADARERAAAEGLELTDFARAAVQRYATAAPDEEWITLMGLLGRTDDPGATCLRRAFAFALQSQHQDQR
jgi:hypothetical protein